MANPYYRICAHPELHPQALLSDLGFFCFLWDHNRWRVLISWGEDESKSFSNLGFLKVEMTTDDECPGCVSDNWWVSWMWSNNWRACRSDNWWVPWKWGDDNWCYLLLKLCITHYWLQNSELMYILLTPAFWIIYSWPLHHKIHHLGLWTLPCSLLTSALSITYAWPMHGALLILDSCTLCYSLLAPTLWIKYY